MRFASGARRDFDVVVGADGPHSSPRAMVFGPEAEFVLAASNGERTAAFAGYERRMRGIVEATQKMGRDIAKRNSARNKFELWVQLQLMRLMPYPPPLKNLVTWERNKAINGIELPDYRALLNDSGSSR